MLESNWTADFGRSGWFPCFAWGCHDDFIPRSAECATEQRSDSATKEKRPWATRFLADVFSAALDWLGVCAAYSLSCLLRMSGQPIDNQRNAATKREQTSTNVRGNADYC